MRWKEPIGWLVLPRIRFKVQTKSQISFLWTQVLDDNMPLGVLNIGDKEATFEAMDYIKHEDSLR